ncbi:MAG: leucine-rich repeat domain-containing protein [Candidatus Hodarchaeales archaeon]
MTLKPELYKILWKKATRELVKKKLFKEVIEDVRTRDTVRNETFQPPENVDRYLEKNFGKISVDTLKSEIKTMIFKDLHQKTCTKEIKLSNDQNTTEFKETSNFNQEKNRKSETLFRGKKDDNEAFYIFINNSGCQIDLHEKNLYEIDLSPVISFNKLTHIFLGGNHLDIVDLKPLGNITYLELFDLSKNNLNEINLDFVRSTYHITTIILNSNRIRNIDLTPLENCKSLQYFDLSNNKIQNIDLSAFKLCLDLIKLDLSHNSIRKIDIFPLKTCNKLEILSLSHNELEIIDLEPLRSCRNLNSLDLYSNHLIKIDLNPLQYCRSLVSLDLSKNRITEIDITPLQYCSDLMNIWIDENVRLVIRKPLAKTKLPEGFNKISHRIIYIESRSIIRSFIPVKIIKSVIYEINIIIKARSEYKKSRGYIHKQILLECRKNIIKRKKKEILKKKNLYYQIDVLQRDKEVELIRTLTEELIESEVENAYSIGPVIQERIARCNRFKSLDDLHKARRYIYGVGAAKQYYISLWVESTKRQFPELLKKDFSGKRTLIRKYENKVTVIKKEIRRIDKEINRLKSLIDMIDTNNNSIGEIKPKHFRQLYKGNNELKLPIMRYQKGLFPELRPLPDWFDEILIEFASSLYKKAYKAQYRGFFNEKDWLEAKSKGFKNKAESCKITKLGFKTKNDFIQARNIGIKKGKEFYKEKLAFKDFKHCDEYGVK